MTKRLLLFDVLNEINQPQTEARVDYMQYLCTQFYLYKYLSASIQIFEFVPTKTVRQKNERICYD